jgi:diguanylate cyclase
MQHLALHWQRLWPPVAAEVRDELALLRYARLTSQVPLLYITLIVLVGTAMQAAAADAPWVVRIGIPTFVTIVCAVRFFWWMRHRSAELTADEARRRIRKTTWISNGVAVLCSIWCLLSWSMANAAQQSFYPLFMAMGSLTTAFCLSSIRTATVSHLALGILPISCGLLVLGDSMDFVAGAIILIATAFLIRMILSQHAQLVDLLMLKHQLREQAHTDPLTGLLNRRALISEAEAAFAGDWACPALALLDLDGFKAVNDRHGHAAGDELLVQIAARMRRVVGKDAFVARLGGDEFAVLITSGDTARLPALVDALLASLVPSFTVGGAVVRLGASAGMASAPADGTSLTSLFATADSALYAAKAGRSAARDTRRSNRHAA